MVKKKQIEEDLRSEFTATLDARIDRYLEIGHHWIIGNHYFTQASTECIFLYRDGRFIAATMMSHAINEAIIEFIAERNSIERSLPNGESKKIDVLIYELQQGGKVSNGCAEAALNIYGSYRNDIHHLNPKIAKLDFPSLALDNIKRLAAIEEEIFGVDLVDGGMIKPRHPIYWDLDPSGYTSAYIRIRS